MRATDTSISANGKAKVAIDYAENIVAGMGILIDKWNQLYTAGIRINDSNPQYAENWYLALWAYNSGIQPGPQFGNTTGCTPGPTCTDQFGNWGLGWTNDPRNATIRRLVTCSSGSPMRTLSTRRTGRTRNGSSAGPKPPSRTSRARTRTGRWNRWPATDTR